MHASNPAKKTPPAGAVRARRLSPQRSGESKSERRLARVRDARAFRERLLAVMDRKNHWAWPAFSGPGITRQQLRIHFQQEFATYVRDFPVYLARIHGRNPPPAVRRMLAENIYEEDTGGLSFGKPHPELFLVMMRGLGLPASDFEDIALLPAARTYRDWLDHVTGREDWVAGAAVMAIFVEGSIKDRQELVQIPGVRTPEEIEDVVRNHALVRYHGVAPQCMDLTRAHQMVEGGHRHDAYAMVAQGVRNSNDEAGVLACLEKTLELWLRYRDDVARACGIE
jgi:Iron-containing redox enzyme